MDQLHQKAEQRPHLGQGDQGGGHQQRAVLLQPMGGNGGRAERQHLLAAVLQSARRPGQTIDVRVQLRHAGEKSRFLVEDQRVQRVPALQKKVLGQIGGHLRQNGVRRHGRPRRQITALAVAQGQGDAGQFVQPGAAEFKTFHRGSPFSAFALFYHNLPDKDIPGGLLSV